MDEFQEQPQEQAQEATIGMGKLLGILAGLVVICAIFFSLGYSFGKKSVATTLIPEPAPATVTPSTPKPSPSQSLGSKSPAGAPSASSPVAAAEPASSESTPNSPSEPPSRPAPELARTGAYAVQVAAVTRQEDAEALLSALRKKDYPVFIVSNQPGDKLFHVQVGPYASMKDAEAMKARLAGDGYNPIVKK